MANTVRDAMTPNPIVMSATSTILEAAQAMRDNDIGDVIAGDEAGNVIGILTDRDVVVRVVSEQRDTGSTTLQEIASIDLVTLTPDTPIDEAIRTMEEAAVRRLPVLEDGKAVGIVSLGDLATQGAGERALDDISAAPPNN